MIKEADSIGTNLRLGNIPRLPVTIQDICRSSAVINKPRSDAKLVVFIIEQSLLRRHPFHFIYRTQMTRQRMLKKAAARQQQHLYYDNRPTN